MSRKILAHTATIHTASIEVHVMKLEKKQVTMSVFRQLREEQIIDDTPALRGVPWGTVNYYWGDDKDCDPDVRPHVVWQNGEELRRCVVPVEGKVNTEVIEANRSLEFASRWVGKCFTSHLLKRWAIDGEPHLSSELWQRLTTVLRLSYKDFILPSALLGLPANVCSEDHRMVPRELLRTFLDYDYHRKTDDYSSSFRKGGGKKAISDHAKQYASASQEIGIQLEDWHDLRDEIIDRYNSWSSLWLSWTDTYRALHSQLCSLDHLFIAT